MRFLPLAGLLLLTPAIASAQTPSAQALYVERRGLLELDVQCRLLAPEMRAALEAGAGQARGALLRGGWTPARVGELEAAAVNAARARRCGDPRTSAAVESARAGFVSWTRAATMTFPGSERTWTARRIPDATRWRLAQDIVSPVRATFGVREDDAGRQHLTLVMPANGPAPASAQMLLRNPSRTSANLLDLRGRTVRGLEAGAPAPATASRYFASARRIDGNVLTFEFPDAVFEAMCALDPRESVVILVGERQRLLVEVGDIAAARAFLVIGARS